MRVCDCDNPEQCWENCGELGNDEDYVEVADDEQAFIINEIVRQGRISDG